MVLAVTACMLLTPARSVVAATTQGTTWPVTVDKSLDAIRTLPNGEIVATRCVSSTSGGTQASYRTDGSLAYSVPGAQSTCGESVVTKGGLVISQAYEGSSVNVYAIGPRGVVRKSRVVNCTGGNTSPRSEPAYAPGLDTVYYVISATCFGKYQNVLVTLNATTGALKFNVPIGGIDNVTQVASYTGGYVFFKHPDTFKYFNANGVLDTKKSFTIKPADYPRLWAVGASGDIVTVGKDAASPTCTGNGGENDRKVNFYRLGAVPMSLLLPYYKSVCMQPIRLGITPNSGAAVLNSVSGVGQTLYLADPRATRTIVPSSLPYTTDYYEKFGGMALLVDDYGNTVIAGSYRQTNRTPRQVAVLSYNPRGYLKKVFTTESLPKDGNDFDMYDGYLALAHGYAYLMLDHGGQRLLTRTPLGAVGMDYPRGKLMGDASSPPAMFVTKILGDSFTSLEGNEPFNPATAVPGKNTCHRSVFAYAHLLARDPKSRIDLGDNDSGFVACSGAKAQALTNPNNGERPQIDSLTRDTNLVILTIGGNDMPFADYVRACITPQMAPCNGVAYQNAMAGIANNVTPNVGKGLAAIRARLDKLGSRATVMVLGYPQVVPDLARFSDTNVGCVWFDAVEIPSIIKVTNALNAAIEANVKAIGGGFKFVSATGESSPFYGHELCRSPTDTEPDYFFNYVPLMQAEAATIHPNKRGAEAYYNLVISNLPAEAKV